MERTFVLLILIQLGGIVVCSAEGKTTHNDRQSRAVIVALDTRLWPNASVPYIFTSSVTASTKAAIKEAMDEVSAFSCVTFTDVQFDLFWDLSFGHSRHLYFQGSNPNYCDASTGFSGFYGEQTVDVGANCAGNEGIPIAVILTSLGFYLEHRRPDRDTYITVQEDQILDWPQDVFTVLWEKVINFGFQYDISSAMHQDGSFLRKDANSLSMIPALPLLQRSDDLQNLGGHVRQNANSLSHRDKAILNEIYNCADECSPLNCLHGGYQQHSTCDCACPPGVTGSRCEELDTTSITDNCGGMITSGSGVLTSPGYPSPYSLRTTCRWMIKSNDISKRICIRVDDMDFDDPQIGRDELWVYIYGPSVDLYSLSYADRQAYMGTWYKSQVNVVTIEFRSPCGTNGRACSPHDHEGFQISYSFECDGIVDPVIAVGGNETVDSVQCESDSCVQDGYCAEGVDYAKCGCIARDAGRRCQERDDLQMYQVTYHVTELYTTTLSTTDSEDFIKLHQRVCLWTYAGFGGTDEQKAYIPCYSVAFTEYSGGYTTINYTMAFNSTLINSNVLGDDGTLDIFDTDKAEASSANLFLIRNPQDLEISDVNECDNPDHNTCDERAECTNNNGGYECECRDGYRDKSPIERLPGRKCKDKNTFDWKWIIIALAIILILCLICCPLICWYYSRQRRHHKEKYAEHVTRRKSSYASSPWSTHMFDRRTSSLPFSARKASAISNTSYYV